MTNKSLAIGLAIGLLSAVQLQSQRKPLFSEPITKLGHLPTSTDVRYDANRKADVRYSIDGAIALIPASKNFLVTWNGSDGKKQSAEFEPPNKVVAVVAADVSFDSRSGLYTYSYSVSTLGGSTQWMQTLYVAAARPENAAKPNSGWYSRPLTRYVADQLQATGGWAWSHVSDSLGIAPGVTVSGFRLVSRRPPALVKCYVAGRQRALLNAEDMPDELQAAIGAVAWKLPSGYTIGPAAANDTGSAASQADLLIASLDEAQKQGWLGGAATANSLRGTLAGIRSSIGRGGSAAAAAAVESTIKDLQGSRYQDVLSEGKALLQYRLPLLRQRLLR